MIEEKRTTIGHWPLSETSVAHIVITHSAPVSQEELEILEAFFKLALSALKTKEPEKP